MKTDEKKQGKKKKINFEVKRVYVGKKPMGEVFEGVIEHIVENNIKNNENRKQTQA